MLIRVIQSWSQSFPEEVHECHKVTCVPPSYTCAKSYTSARVPKCQQDTRVPQKKQKCHILVIRVPIHLCVFATTNAYLLRQQIRTVPICYHKCVFATVANTHTAYLLPQMHICYHKGIFATTNAYLVP